MSGENLFAPYRALGYVSSDVPFALQAKGDNHFATTAVGDAFHVYNCKKLNLVFVGRVDGEIRCMTTFRDLIITSTDRSVRAWKRGKQVAHYEGHSGSVHTMITFGDQLIVVSSENTVTAYDIGTGEIRVALEDLDPLEFGVSSLMHPSTYLNKILIGSQQGTMYLWNLKTNQRIFTYEGWGSAVQCLEQAPAVDIVGVGLQSGQIIIHNLKLDRTLMRFNQDGGPVTALSFRSDAQPLLASASTLGHISVWDLDRRRLATVLSDCHNGSVSGMRFLQSRPMMLTTGTDNALKLWVFDQEDFTGRLLRSRSGHSAPPRRLRFYGAHDVLSCGPDRTLMNICVIADERTGELSQGSLLKRSRKLGVSIDDLRLPQVLAFAAESARERDWDNVVTCHAATPGVRTWSYDKKRLGKHTLSPPTEDSADVASSVCMSSCGNFCLVGYNSGRVSRFNVQSGLMRGSYGRPCHAAAVRGVASDALNRRVATCSLDKTVKIWHFQSRKLEATVEMGVPVQQIELQRESNLLAAVGADFTVRLVDMDTQRIVRVFDGHVGSVTDIAWSPDSRWLVTSSMDTTVRTWDIPSGRLISWFSVSEPVTSLSFSPSGEYLATAHVDSVGVYLWANRSLYEEVSLRPVEAVVELPEVVALPRTGGGLQSDVIADYLSNEGERPPSSGADSTPAETFKSPEQLDSEFITLSDLPQSRWANLSDLDEIRRRNKPTEAPKAPKSAPFFLSTIPGLSTSFKPTEDPLAQTDVASNSRILHFGKAGAKSQFQTLLCSCGESGEYRPLLSALKSMGLSGIDLEIRSLSMEDDLAQFRYMLAFFAQLLQEQTDFELVQSYMHLFLKVHGDVLATNPDLLQPLQSVAEQQGHAWTRLSALFQHVLCMTAFFKHSGI